MRQSVPLASGALIFILFPAAPGAGEGIPGAGLIRLTAGQVVVYEGSIHLKQTAGAEVQSEESRRASLLYRAREPAPGRLNLVIFRRLLAPSGADDGKPELAAIDEFEDQASAAAPAPARLESIEDSVPGMEEAHGQLDFLLPVALLPPFALPALGSESRSADEVPILGLAQTKVPMVTSVRKEGDRIWIRRTLGDAGAEFPYQEGKGKLLTWREEFAADAASGAPLKVEAEVAIEVPGGEGSSPIRVVKGFTLEARQVTAPGGGDAARLDALEAELRGLGADLRAVKPAADIEKRLEAFKKLAAATPFEAAAAGLPAALKSFRAFFEETAEGKQLARLINKPAPDFKLKDLNDREVQFGAAIKGKATLLNFWGYG